MRNSKNLLVLILLIFIAASSANAQTGMIQHHGDRYDNLTYDYFYGKNSKVSVDIKRIIASDPKSSVKVLEILTHDSDVAVWLLAQDNLKGYL